MSTREEILEAIKNSTSVGTSSIDAENRASEKRNPFIMYTELRKSQSQTRKLIFRCNPSGIAYSHPQRGATQDVKNGKVFYFWRQKKAGSLSHWDLPAITFSFKSGNIRPMIEEGDQVYLPEGLDNFYEFMSILDEEKQLKDGSPNFVVIEHHSNIYPSLILRGFFDPAQKH